MRLYAPTPLRLLVNARVENLNSTSDHAKLDRSLLSLRNRWTAAAQGLETEDRRGPFRLLITAPKQLFMTNWNSCSRQPEIRISPTILDKQTGKALLKLHDSAWSAERSSWVGDAEIVMELRRYPGDHPHPCVAVRLDCLREVGWVDDGDGVPLNQVEREASQALLDAK